MSPNHCNDSHSKGSGGAPEVPLYGHWYSWYDLIVTSASSLNSTRRSCNFQMSLAHSRTRALKQQ